MKEWQNLHDNPVLEEMVKDGGARISYLSRQNDACTMIIFYIYFVNLKSAFFSLDEMKGCYFSGHFI